MAKSGGIAMELGDAMKMPEDTDGITYGPTSNLLREGSDYRIFRAKRLCPDGCPPCLNCGIHMDSWWYFLNGGYCNPCSVEKETTHAH